MGVCQGLRQALKSGEPVVSLLCYDPLARRIPGDPAEIKMLRDEIYKLVNPPKYWELESRTVGK